LVDRLVLRGRVDEADSIRRLSRLADMRFVRQPEALGVGHAIACATEEIGDEPFAVLLPDNIVDFEVPCIKQLMECYQSFPGCVVAGRAIDPRLTSSFGMLLTEPVAGIKDSDRVLKVIELIEKPAPGTTPAIYGIHGRYVLEPSVLSCLDRQIPTNRGEVQITDALSMHIREGGAVHMLKFDGETYDTGDKLGYIKANIAFGLKHPEIGFQLREHLRTLSS
jgi:UTP--glucose-1-phosphate uridylyltransferase